MQLVIGGNHSNYTGKAPTLTTEMLVAKLLFNSVVSTKGTQFIDDIPEEIISQYGLHTKATSEGQVYIEVNIGMYRLP